MDREFEKLKRALDLDPKNLELQQRLANTTQRIPQKEFDQALEAFVLFLSGMAKVLVDCVEYHYSDPELESQRTAPGMLVRLWDDSFASTTPPDFSKLIRSRLSHSPNPQAPEFPRSINQRNPSQSIWEPCLEFCEIFVDILYQVYKGEWERSKQDIESLTTPFLSAVSDMVNHCFEDGNYAWTYEMLPAPPLSTEGDEAGLLLGLQRVYAHSKSGFHPLFGVPPRDAEAFLGHIDESCHREPFVATRPSSFPGFWPTIRGSGSSWGGLGAYFSEALNKVLNWHFQVPAKCYGTSAMSRATHFHMSLVKVADRRFYLRTYYD
ncbi:MAG: hypothetical protein P1V97_19005 [Planctomycetota bacterium]|nr:hypothetical protein [Planctomycetota bacterium]